MIYKKLGRTGEKIPAIGMGTWKLGANPEDEIHAIREGIRLGMNFVDTAEMYHTEQIVGEALKGQDDVFVATKVSPDHLRYKDVIKACDQSLKTMGIKTIDLYQIHWPNPNIPISQTMQAMERLVKEGKIRHIGVSNFLPEELVEAQEAMKSNEIVSNQVEYSVLARDIEKELLQICTKAGITVIAYSPLARGSVYNGKDKAFSILDKIAKKHNKTIAQVSLSWVIEKEDVIAIPKTASPDHMAENASASEFKLDKEDLEQIDSIRTGFMPISRRLNRFTKRTSILWSKLMEKRESLRKFKI
ncbi:MAG: aldo/keto reductase [Candidatus Micrarchaeota archaeon]|nr:aldo/keto reductase [Candidatus Micrarchaeota archaeon]MDE1834664.1 aldo/keto reductase [Candidatus Micrarchaeota archaeon]MDE1858951.1 aldo/keto reductase [Candidatus Micrarchaeota archaeon]